jgi:hypothetical protein
MLRDEQNGSRTPPIGLSLTVYWYATLPRSFQWFPRIEIPSEKCFRCPLRHRGMLAIPHSNRGSSDEHGQLRHSAERQPARCCRTPVRCDEINFFRRIVVFNRRRSAGDCVGCQPDQMAGPAARSRALLGQVDPGKVRVGVILRDSFTVLPSRGKQTAKQVGMKASRSRHAVPVQGPGLLTTS